MRRRIGLAGEGRGEGYGEAGLSRKRGSRQRPPAPGSPSHAPGRPSPPPASLCLSSIGEARGVPERSVDVQTAVDVELYARAVGGEIGGEEKGTARHLPRLAHPAEGNGSEDGGEPFGR